jgi:hypothetical protein
LDVISLILKSFFCEFVMPFLEYDPREHKAYKDVKVPRGVVVPTTDAAAWWLNQDYCHIYNKLDLALQQGLEAAPIGVDPDVFPIFMKPIINLWGGGSSSRVIRSREELNKFGRPGMFWMPHLKGKHLSHDFAVDNGTVTFHLVMEGKPIGRGMFDYWQSIKIDSGFALRLAKWIQDALPDYTGMVNLETIGGKIIEVHLRWGDSWCSGDATLLQAVVDLYAGKHWNYKNISKEFFIFPIWGDPKRKYQIPREVANEIELNTLIGDLEHEEGGPTPPGGQRLALFSTHERKYGLQLRRRVIAAFKPRIAKKFTEKLS